MEQTAVATTIKRYINNQLLTFNKQPLSLIQKRVKHLCCSTHDGEHASNRAPCPFQARLAQRKLLVAFGEVSQLLWQCLYRKRPQKAGSAEAFGGERKEKAEEHLKSSEQFDG